MVSYCCLGEEVVLRGIEGMLFVFMRRLEVGDEFPRDLNGKVTQRRRPSPAEKPPEFFLIASQGLGCFSLSTAGYYILVYQRREGYIFLIHLFPAGSSFSDTRHGLLQTSKIVDGKVTHP